MEDAKVTRPKRLVAVLGGHLGEVMVAAVAVNPNNTIKAKLRAHLVCDRSRPFAVRRSN
jgi:hypothetical protein